VEIKNDFQARYIAATLNRRYATGKLEKLIPVFLRSGLEVYTNKGVASIIEKIQARNFGVIPSNIDVFTWYNFIYHECILPYQKTMFHTADIRGITFEGFYGGVNFAKKTEMARYITKNDHIKAKHAAEFVVECVSKGNNLIQRLSEIYEEIIVDEVQDLAGEDLDFIEQLMDSSIRVTLIGDSRQATFTTHASTRYKKFKGINIVKYFEELKKGSIIDIIEWNECRRSNKAICSFADRIFPTLPAATSAMDIQTGHDGVFIIQESDLEFYISFLASQKTGLQFLKYDAKTKTAYRTLNFGECKGLTFDRTIIFTNNPLTNFIENFTCDAPAKYYVGLTRARYSVAIIVKALPHSTVYKDTELEFDDKRITIKEYTC